MNNLRLTPKLILIIIILLAFGLSVISYTVSQTKKNPGSTPAPQKLIISQVPVTNFEANPVEQNYSGDTMIAKEPDYQFAYVKQLSQFFITITNPDFSQTRPKAEQAFIKELGISEEDACKLNVIISTPTFANPELSGQTFPLSFCK